MFSSYETGLILEFTRVARMELILDKVEEMLIGLEIPRTSFMWLWWEIQAERQEQAYNKIFEEVEKHNAALLDQAGRLNPDPL